MEISWSQTTSLICQQCATAFEAEVWLIIDTTERPDLLERVHNGTLHHFACPTCNYTVDQVDAPLLLYRPNETLPLIFSSPERITTEQLQEQGNGLLLELRERLGDAWRDDLLKHGLVGIARPQLSIALIALKEDPAGFLDQMNQSTQRVGQTSLLAQTLQQFLEADSWPASYQFLQSHPELLSDEIDGVLEAFVAEAEAQGDAEDVLFFEEHRDLLHRCREIGVESAFVEKMNIASEAINSLVDQAENDILGRSDNTPGEISLSRTTSLPCPRCSTRFKVEVWLIVNTVEHPELLEQVRNERLNVYDCPNCSQPVGQVDAPLLLYRPDETPALLFSPSQESTDERVQKHATALVTILRERLGAAWQDAWITPEVPGGTRSFLPLLLGVKPDAAKGSVGPDAGVPPEFFYEDMLHAVEARRRYQAHGDIADLEDAIAAWEHILNHPDFKRAPTLFQLDALSDAGTAFRRRYRATGQSYDLDQAIHLWQHVVQNAPTNAAKLPHYLLNLGGGLQDRYYLNKQLKDLEQAIEFLQKAAQYNRTDVLPSLGACLSDHYKWTGRLESLEQSIEAFQQVIRQTPPDSPDLPDYLNSLGINLLRYFEHTGSLGTLRGALEASRQAVERSMPDSPRLPYNLNSLGNSLRIRYEHFGKIEDLEQAIEVYRRATQHPLVNSVDLPGYLSSLGAALTIRYEHTGQVEDLEQAIQLLEQAVQNGADDAEDLSSILHNFGNSLRIHYEYSGRLEELEQAIEVMQRDVQLTPTNSPEMSGSLSNLAIGLLNLYQRTGQLENLEQAIEAFQSAVQHTPTHAPRLLWSLNNLGIGLLEHYQHTRQREDLEQAIEAFQRIMQHIPADSPDSSLYLSNLGSALRARYERTGRLEDLEQAIEAHQKAVQYPLADAPGQAIYFNGLGAAFNTRYERTGRLEDLEQAIEAYQKAVQYSPIDAPILPSGLNNLANGLRERYVRTGQPEDLRRAVQVYEEACQKGLRLDPAVTLISSRIWGNWAIEQERWIEAARAYGYGVRATEQLYQAQLLRVSQETWLSEARDLHIRAAYAFARTHQSREAVIVLEQGRARALSDALARDRADLERVRQEDQGAYDSYQRAAERLRQLERAERDGNLLAGERTALRVASPVEQIGQARKELEQAIVRIRQIPDFENFLVKPTYDDVAQASQRDNPLVYLATTGWGSLALLVHSGSDAPELIWAENFTHAHMYNILVKSEGEEVIGGYLFGQLSNSQWLSKTLYEMLPQLGRDITGPIATRLRELEAKGVVLIPTGLLALLPLHAALYKSNNREVCLLDEFDVAYAPSARVLAAVRREAEKRLHSVSGSALQFVGIGNPLTDPEVGAWVQEELRRIVPKLQEGISVHIRRLQDSVAILPSEGRIWIRNLIALWEQSLQRLQTLCHETPERVIYSGSELLRAAGLFADLTGLTDDIGATLIRLATRIPPSLTYAHAELESVLTLLPRDSFTSFYEQQATRDALWNTLPQSTIAHFACHGSFDLEAPLDSALMLARETRLTLRDLLNAEPRQLANLHLTFLSACQTAITDFLRLPDEAVGLLSGFLQAGVPSVVGTLWSVDDLSTALLVARFYELYLQGDEQSNLPRQQPARALRLAQDWLRKLTNNNLYAYLSDGSSAQHISPKLRVEQLPLLRQAIRQGQGEEHPYADPYYWAPFVYYGTL